MVGTREIGRPVLEQPGFVGMKEAALHSTPEDCWIVIDGKIYEMTKYLEDHPGGADVLLGDPDRVVHATLSVHGDACLDGGREKQFEWALARLYLHTRDWERRGAPAAAPLTGDAVEAAAVEQMQAPEHPHLVALLNAAQAEQASALLLCSTLLAVARHGELSAAKLCGAHRSHIRTTLPGRAGQRPTRQPDEVGDEDGEEVQERGEAWWHCVIEWVFSSVLPSCCVLLLPQS